MNLAPADSGLALVLVLVLALALPLAAASSVFDDATVGRYTGPVVVLGVGVVSCSTAPPAKPKGRFDATQLEG